MKRRRFLQALALAASGVSVVAWSAPAASRRLLILVELKGGNDGLNTLVPYADEHYRRLRPRLAIERDAVLKLSDHHGLHPSLAKLAGPWEAREIGRAHV